MASYLWLSFLSEPGRTFDRRQVRKPTCKHHASPVSPQNGLSGPQEGELLRTVARERQIPSRCRKGRHRTLRAQTIRTPRSQRGPSDGEHPRCREEHGLSTGTVSDDRHVSLAEGRTCDPVAIGAESKDVRAGRPRLKPSRHCKRKLGIPGGIQGGFLPEDGGN